MTQTPTPHGADLTGRVALITGSTRGVGAAIARRYAHAGARVVITGRSEDAGADLESSIRDDGGDATYVRMDVGVETQVRHAIDHAVRTYGSLDVLVNNAAPLDLVTSADANVVDLSTEGLDRILKPALYGSFWAAKYAIPHLSASGHGAIVNISAASSKVGIAKLGGYSIAKGALNAMSRQIAVDFADTGLRSNTIIIGYVLTPDVQAAMDADPALARTLDQLILTRRGTPEDIAEAALFLASDSAGFITGSEVNLDGGMLAARNLPDLTKQPSPGRG